MSFPFFPGRRYAHNGRKRRAGGVRVNPVLLLLLLFAGHAGAGAPGAEAFNERLVWALNVGGGAFESWVGETYAADDCKTGRARCGALSDVARTQNETLYRSYRSGAQRYRKALPPGLYDAVLYFVEPSPVDGKSRRFDVLVEGRTMLADLNLLSMKNGQAAAAVTRALPAVAVRDGYLDIELAPGAGDPVLAGLLVRQSRFTTDGWEQVWADEFDGDGLDPRSWSVETWPARFVNDEDQAYTAQQKNVRTVNGHLVLEAHYEGATDAAYSSGRVHSGGKRSLHHGRVDVRARVPEGRGVWPAIWFLPEDPFRYATRCGPEAGEWQGNADCDAWPNSGEIDLMEHVGNQPGIVHGTVHTRDYFGGLGTQIGEAIAVPGLGREFQVYSLIWEEGAMAMYVDGHRYFAYRDSGQGSGQWPFDQPFHVILNLAVGGFWGREGGPIDRSAFPRRLEVDYVRFFKPRTNGREADQ